MKWIKWIITCLLVFSFFPAIPTTYANTDSVLVDTQSLHIRSGPGLTYSVTGSLKKGDHVKVISTEGDWLEIQDGNTSGWIASWLTTTGTGSAETATPIVSRVDQLNIRSGPSIGSAVLGRMDAGDEAIMTSQDGDWSLITFNGLTGWVHKDYISQLGSRVAEAAPMAQIASAESFTVGVDALNVRQKADLSSKRVGLIHRGESYAIEEIDGNWVLISIGNNKQGWVYSFHGILSSQSKKASDEPVTETVTILSDGTNIREQATTSSQILARADAGEKFPIVQRDGDWYEISLPSGQSAFVAKWVVSTDEDTLTTEPVMKQKTARVPGTLKGLTIVIDPGHGGNDRGTTGSRGTDEKGITLLTSELLAAKLRASGANVVMTREADTYVPLRKRVAVSHQADADAFISIHYDANPDSRVTGFTTYYTHSQQKELAATINDGLASSISLRNRGSQPGDFLVLRENRQNAILIELGFLSNAAEERIMTNDIFREQASHGIYQGLLDYFNASGN